MALALAVPVGPPLGAPRDHTAGLSGRETEVLRLVTHGWTNVFRKIDVDNRTEAVRWAVDAGLT